MKKEIYEDTTELELRYYELALEESQKISKLKHDIKNYIQTMYALFNNENSQKKQIGIEMLGILREKIERITEINYCENKLINIILALKIDEAHQYGITTKIDVKIDDNINLNKVELCSIFSNLLDNAISASKKNSANRFIEVKAKIKLDYLIIRVTNSTIRTVNIDRIIETKKKTKKDHGLGLKILQDISKKYSGQLDLESENKKFTAIVTLKIK